MRRFQRQEGDYDTPLYDLVDGEIRDFLNYPENRQVLGRDDFILMFKIQKSQLNNY